MEHNMIGVGVDTAKKELVFMEKFNYKDARNYIKVCKIINEKLPNSIAGYKIKFENKAFEDVIDLCKACSASFDKEIEELLNPDLNMELFNKLKITSIDIDNKLIKVDSNLSKETAVSIIGHIPTLMPFKIDYKDKIYANVIELAEEALKDYSKGDWKILTNTFVEEVVSEVFDNKDLDEDDND